jgi:hypothetical protein
VAKSKGPSAAIRNKVATPNKAIHNKAIHNKAGTRNRVATPNKDIRVDSQAGVMIVTLVAETGDMVPVPEEILISAIRDLVTSKAARQDTAALTILTETPRLMETPQWRAVSPIRIRHLVPKVIPSKAMTTLVRKDTAPPKDTAPKGTDLKDMARKDTVLRGGPTLVRPGRVDHAAAMVMPLEAIPKTNPLVSRETRDNQDSASTPKRASPRISRRLKALRW